MLPITLYLINYFYTHNKIECHGKKVKMYVNITCVKFYIFTPHELIKS